MKSGNSAMVRRINREVIREALRTRGEAGIAELSRSTGLSPATCSNIIPGLVADGEVLELDERRSRGGRPARVYAYNPDHTLIAAILLLCADGGTAIRHSIRNGAGAVVSSGAAAPEPFSLKRLDAFLDRLLRDFPAIRAVALSVPGVVDNSGGAEMCDIAELSGVNLEKHIRSRHALATVVENDTNFAAAGYQSNHPETAGSGLAFMLFPVDKAPGCGIALGGALVKGKSNFAGEVSFIPFGAAPPCSVEEEAARLCCAV
ncbi:MAG: ROK family protein, partial [Planctomycetota bacterium]|nr:ROK family protein [Planctomycetota bacterium]